MENSVYSNVTELSAERKVYENPIIGDKVVFLKTSRETGGTYSLLEVEVAPGGGNAPHIHGTFFETFTSLEGNLEVRAGKEQKLLPPGKSFTIPPEMTHCFRNPSNKPVKFLVEIRPGHEGFEQCLKIAYGLSLEGLTDKKSVPKNFSHLALLATMSDTNPTGIFSLLMPVFRWKARQARQRGIEQELINKYCR